MSIERDIVEIKQRNARVEADKAWETSFARRGLVAVATYIAASALFVSINVTNPFGNALIPTVAYAISTLSLPFVKKWWIGKRRVD
jgi:uncharacterized membrane protein YfbV (UPF0208 family)